MAKYSFQNAKYNAEIETFFGQCSMFFPNIDEARKGAVKLAKEYNGTVDISKLDGQQIGKVYGHNGPNHTEWYYESYTPSGTTKDLKKFNPKTGKLKR